MDEEKNRLEQATPVIALRDMVVFPYMAVPLFVGRDKSIAAITHANEGDQHVFLTAQKQHDDEEPDHDQLYEVGTYAKVLQVMQLPDGTNKVLVEGLQRARATAFHAPEEQKYITADLVLLNTEEDSLDDKQWQAMLQSVLSALNKLSELSGQISKDSLSTIKADKDLGRVVDMTAALLSTSVQKRQNILKQSDLKARAEQLLTYLYEEIDILEVEQTIKSRVQSQVEKNQREYYLNEQLKAIHKELGDVDETQELEQLKQRIEASHMSDEARKKAFGELKKLKGMPMASSEASVGRTYIETLLSLPWYEKTKVKRDLVRAEKVLNQDHYGLEKVKERILEYLAVGQRQRKLKGPILCLVGPPGVGKTSVGRSIARATGREYVRMALGGVKDESEIRGHRRTYIGSLPGQIMQKMIKVGTRNPLFLLDEIDKLSSDFRGDPASALLEVLDPEQNHTFNDHYLEVDYDLSDVMFITTANSLDTIPEPLRDRTEIIDLSGYTENEKMNIAQQYLVPKAIKENNVKKGELTPLSNDVLLSIIRYYTREAGVRQLEQMIHKICRQVVKKNALAKKRGSFESVTITSENVEDYLGVTRYHYGLMAEAHQVGQVTGLAWTQVGGDLLTIETAMMPGKGKVKATGKLGKVMEESIDAAYTVVRSHAEAFDIATEQFQKQDFHIHVPEGAIPKDGPSAGVGMATALMSVVTGRAVRRDVAMTGEITLRGEVLPIGGLKEKLLAAQRGGITTVLIPQKNEKDLKEVPDDIKDGLTIQPVNNIEQVWSTALIQE